MIRRSITAKQRVAEAVPEQVLETGSIAEPTNQRSASQHVCPFHNISADGAVAGRRPLCCGAFSAGCLRYPGFRLRAEADLWLARYLGGGPGSVAALIFWTDARLPCKEKQLGMRLLVHLLASVVLTFLSFYVFVALSVLLGFEAWSSPRGTRFLASAFHEGILWSWLVYKVIFGARQTFRYYEHYLASQLRLDSPGEIEFVLKEGHRSRVIAHNS